MLILTDWADISTSQISNVVTQCGSTVVFVLAVSPIYFIYLFISLFIYFFIYLFFFFLGGGARS